MTNKQQRMLEPKPERRAKLFFFPFLNLSDGQESPERSVAVCFPPPVRAESQSPTQPRRRGPPKRSATRARVTRLAGVGDAGGDETTASSPEAREGGQVCSPRRPAERTWSRNQGQRPGTASPRGARGVRDTRPVLAAAPQLGARSPPSFPPSGAPLAFRAGRRTHTSGRSGEKRVGARAGAGRPPPPAPHTRSLTPGPARPHSLGFLAPPPPPAGSWCTSTPAPPRSSTARRPRAQHIWRGASLLRSSALRSPGVLGKSQSCAPRGSAAGRDAAGGGPHAGRAPPRALLRGLCAIAACPGARAAPPLCAPSEETEPQAAGTRGSRGKRPGAHCPAASRMRGRRAPPLLRRGLPTCGLGAEPRAGGTRKVCCCFFSKGAVPRRKPKNFSPGAGEAGEGHQQLGGLWPLTRRAGGRGLAPGARRPS